MLYRYISMTGEPDLCLRNMSADARTPRHLQGANYMVYQAQKARKQFAIDGLLDVVENSPARGRKRGSGKRDDAVVSAQILRRRRPLASQRPSHRPGRR